MESGQNLYELEKLLQTSIKQYKDTFREQLTKYHDEIKEKLQKDIANKP